MIITTLMLMVSMGVDAQVKTALTDSAKIAEYRENVSCYELTVPNFEYEEEGKNFD